MTPKPTEEQLAQSILETATRGLRAYAESNVSRQAIELLDALGHSYCMDLIHVKPDDLIRLQAALKQVYALRSVFADEGMDTPKI